ncbi:hypothetical protein D3C83_21620 [compost metagenome]
MCREDGQWLDGLAARRYRELAVETPGRAAADGERVKSVELDAAAVRADPPPVQRRVVLAAIRALAGDREAGLEHLETALDVLAGECGGADLPGCRVELHRGKLVLVSRQG